MVKNFEFGTPKSRRTDSGNKVNEFEPDSVVLWVWATIVLPPREKELRPFRGRLHIRVCAAGTRPMYSESSDNQTGALAEPFVPIKDKGSRSYDSRPCTLSSRDTLPDQIISSHWFDCAQTYNPFRSF